MNGAMKGTFPAFSSYLFTLETSCGERLLGTFNIFKMLTFFFPGSKEWCFSSVAEAWL